MIGLVILLSLAALAGAIFLIRSKPVVLPLLALIASGIEVAIGFRLIRFSIAGISLTFVLGGILAVTGVLILLRVNSKWQVASATVVALVGAIQVLKSLHIIT